jgi:hypothetical protein
MLSIDELFKQIEVFSQQRDYKLKVSYVEVYNENIKDTLVDIVWKNLNEWEWEYYYENDEEDNDQPEETAADDDSELSDLTNSDSDDKESGKAKKKGNNKK